MAISFPTSLDNFTNPSSGNTLDSPSHSLQHSDINDAVEAMQRKVGVGTAVAGSASAGQVLTISAAGTSTWSTPTPGGLVQIVPSSVAVGSGSASVNSNGEVSFTGVSSVSLNDCFNSTYRNYLMLFTITATSAATADIYMRLRVSGSDASGSNYNSYMTGINSASGAFNFVANAVSNWTFTAQHSSLTQGYNVARVEIFNPNLANPSEFTAQSLGLSSAGQYFSFAGAGLHDVATAYTGLTWIKSSGTMTGTVSVYGFRN